MKVGSSGGRLVFDTGFGWIDAEHASGGRFAADIQAVFAVWDEFIAWGETVDTGQSVRPLNSFDLPVPRPGQVIAVGLNYRAHAVESNLPIPDEPMVFTKFASSLIGDGATVPLPSRGVD